MTAKFLWLLAVASLMFGGSVLALEYPPKDFQELMQSNGKVIDISLGQVRSAVGAGVGQGGTASLRAHLRAKDYDGILMDAATLKANFTKIEAFWTQRKVTDAVQ